MFVKFSILVGHQAVKIQSVDGFGVEFFSPFWSYIQILITLGVEKFFI